MNFNDTIDNAKYGSSAQRIKEHLEKIDIDKEKSRWIWELCQNAVDTIEEDQKISINFCLTENSLLFQHTGGNFSMHDLLKFVFPEGKDTDEANPNIKQLGRFGSGFLSTHIVSFFINISGCIEDKKLNEQRKFSLPIDRTEYLKTKKKESLIQSMKESEKCILSNTFLSEWNENYIYTASFEYYFNHPENNPLYITEQKGIDIVKSTFDVLDLYVPYILTFIPKIEQITICNKTLDREDIFKKLHNSDLDDKIVSIQQIEKHNNSNKKIFYIATESEAETSISIGLEKTDDTYRLMPILDDFPKLFFGFPLIGTEEFPFPTIINSYAFYPQHDRDGIELTFNENEKQSSKENKKILTEQVIALHKKLLEKVSKTDFKRKSYICKNKFTITDLSLKNWYVNTLQKKLRENIQEHEIIYTNNGLKKISEVYFPYAKTAELRSLIWKFSNDIAENWNLPVKNEVEEWIDVVWDKGKHQTIETLVSDVASLEKLSELKNRIDTKPSIWISDFLGFIRDNADNLLDENIIPNQKQILNSKSDLYEDKIEDNIIRTIAKILLSNFSKTILYNNVKNEFNIKQKNNNKTVKEILDVLNSNIDKYEDLDELERNKSFAAIFRISRCIPVLIEEDEHLNIDFVNKRKSISTFVSHFYNKKSHSIKETTVNITNKDLWLTSDSFIVEHIAREIHEISIQEDSHLLLLSKKLNLNEQEALIWLDKFLQFVYIHEKALFEKYSLFFNQNLKLTLKDKLFKDDDIPEILKDVVAILNKIEDCKLEYNWKDILLIKEYNNQNIFTQVQSLFFHPFIKQKKDIAFQIDQKVNAFKAYKDNIKANASEEEYKSVFNLFSEFVNKLIGYEKDCTSFSSLFPIFDDKKSELFLSIFEKEEIRNGVYDILQAQEKFPTIVKLASNNNIDAENLEFISNAPNVISKVKTINKFSDNEINYINNEQEKIGNYIKQSIENKERISKNKEYGNKAEKEFEKVLKQKIQNLNLEIKNKQRGQDIEIQDDEITDTLLELNSKYLIEIKSIENENSRVLMSSKQIETAQQEKMNYCLCIVKRGDYDFFNEDDITNAHYITDIGNHIEQFQKNQPNIGIEISKDKTTKYKIANDLWNKNNYLGINNLVKSIKECFNK